MREWHRTRGDVRPETTDIESSKTSVLLAKNITEIEVEDEHGKRTEFEYDLCFVDKGEWNAEQVRKQKANVDYLSMMTGIDIPEV